MSDDIRQAGCDEPAEAEASEDGGRQVPEDEPSENPTVASIIAHAPIAAAIEKKMRPRSGKRAANAMAASKIAVLATAKRSIVRQGSIGGTTHRSSGVAGLRLEG